MKSNIYLVEDDPDIQELIRYNLSKEGFQVRGFGNGEGLLLAVREKVPDLILLDLMLPGIDGLEVCRRLKREERFRSLPVIMITAKGEEADVVSGLEIGADDYVVKPFSPRVLLARVKTVLRRGETEPGGNKQDGEELLIKELAIHPGRHEVTVNGIPLVLTVGEFKILHTLAKRPGWVFTRGQLVASVHGDDYIVTERSIDVMVVGLRKKLLDAGQYIETVRGVGYRFKE